MGPQSSFEIPESMHRIISLEDVQESNAFNRHSLTP